MVGYTRADQGTLRGVGEASRTLRDPTEGGGCVHDGMERVTGRETCEQL